MNNSQSIPTIYRLPFSSYSFNDFDVERFNLTKEVINDYMNELEYKNNNGTISTHQKVELNYIKKGDILGWINSVGAFNLYRNCSVKE